MICSASQQEMQACHSVMTTSYQAAQKAGFPDRGKADFSLEDFVAECAKGDMLFTCKDDGKIVGVLRMRRIGQDTCKIMDIAVLPERQGSGYGWKLLNFAKEKAGALGSKRIELGMFDDDTSLRRWYERNGFVSIQTKPFEGTPFVIRIMEHRL